MKKINEKFIQTFYQILGVPERHYWFNWLFKVLNYHIKIKPNINNIHALQTFDHLLLKIKIYINPKH